MAKNKDKLAQEFKNFKKNRGIEGYNIFLLNNKTVIITKEKLGYNEIRSTNSFNNSVKRAKLIIYCEADGRVKFKSYEDFIRYTLISRLAGI